MSIVKSILDKIPDVIDFDFCTAMNPTSKSFFLDNSSNKDIYYKIQYQESKERQAKDNTYFNKILEGFKISPLEGIIPKHSKQEIVIGIFPKEAQVLIANCKIILDEIASKIIKMSFISKYPHVKINRNNLDFGNVLIGKSKEMELIIKNPEKVPAKFTIVRETETHIKSQNCFHLKTMSGEIPKNCSYLIKIMYVPNNPDVLSYESFTVKVNGGNEILFNCFGKCLPLSTSISSKQVNFESIELGKSNSKVIRVFNDSDNETFFQFYYSNEGIFSFQPKQGLIKPHSNERISVSFNPRENITYYDKAFCLFKHHMLVVSYIS